MSKPSPAVRESVRRLLERSPSFRQLAGEERRRLADDLEVVTDTLSIAASAKELARAGFIDELVRGTFEAIVDASTEQLQAYGELLAAVASGVDDPSRAREALVEGGLAPVRGSVHAQPIRWPR
ncbi:MAG TPA: hypothetical protein VHE35_02855 [Kofleriaceae bacterium]|nr:hypothetical protein [Kofleriaceae bacterium]